jgi:hypothetical protein
MYFPGVGESILSDCRAGFRVRALRDRRRGFAPAECGFGFVLESSLTEASRSNTFSLYTSA